MKLEQSEKLFIKELYANACEKVTHLEELTDIDRLTGDASTRRYYRLLTENSSYVACLDNPCREGENSFVNSQDFLTNNTVRVPNIIAKSLSKGFILEEDLGDITLLSHLAKVENFEEELSIYKKNIDNLCGIHKIPEGKIKGTKFAKLKFDFEKFQSEIEFTTMHFSKTILKNSDKDWIESVNEEFKIINKILAGEDMVLTHRDFHSRNIMVKDGDYIIIDFQDMRLGLRQYDLVSVLDDCYYELSASNRIALKKYYFEKMFSDTSDQSYKKFLEIYDFMLLQRVFKAIGSFSYIYSLRKDERYLKYIGFAIEKIKRTMMKYPELNDLRFLIMDKYYES